MKGKISIILLSATLALVSCNKSEQKIKNESITYKATDGSRAKVSFKRDGKDGTLKILANSKTFELDYKETTNGTDIYERSGIIAKVKADSLSIEQDNNIIELVKDL